MSDEFEPVLATSRRKPGSLHPAGSTATPCGAIINDDELCGTPAEFRISSPRNKFSIYLCPEHAKPFQGHERFDVNAL
jgi:hypothetical protein